MTYVDDFKMSGPSSQVAQAWNDIRKHIDMEDPKPIEKYLGCAHRRSKGNINGKVVSIMDYDMSDFMRQCVASSITLAGGPGKVKLRKV